ncbi:DUF928 domain-containing protein [Microcoleus sp. FACHB-68]|uniref:DUF928 domain-containing protein n=1 Tax=Microcoleus sp. FACHB-68 TaxID=2692826 RepID=UPI00168760D7|nr:DUF928 domain-containing protein [Microcoleus sp. FACHB-68]MBD1939054.1 DUF928 domain-containing protein [Microcoleus sp. FACHB-68]
MKPLFSSIKLAVFITLGMIAGFTHNALAIPTQSIIKISQAPPPVPPVGTPDGPQKGSGTRPPDSKCPAVSNAPVSFFSTKAETIAESPTFLFYIPYASKDIAFVSFVILDDQDKVIQNSEKIQIPETPGFINLHLPPGFQPLEIGKLYRWYLSIHCDPQKLEDGIFFEGAIHRISPSSEFIEQLQEASPKERIIRYRQAGYWYKALSLLTELRSKNPNDPELKAIWNELLTSPDYSEIVDEPINPSINLD